jgi:hypothetical protein
MVRARRCANVLFLLIALSLLLGCRSSLMSKQVVILVDGQEISLPTTVLTVREALAEAGVTVGPEDRAQPDLWVELEDGMAIRVIRVQEEVIVERQVVAYTQQVIKSEALSVGEQKLLQAGKNGEVEVTYRLQFQDGVEIARSILQRVVITEPVPQIVAVGVAGVVESVEIQGSIAYLNSGNAWIMRGASGGRYAVTSEGKLDGRVFSLSPDGAYLLYSVPTDTVEYDGAFNELYLLSVVLVQEEPQRLPIQNVLWAGWSPDGRQIAYSTGVKSGPPGWKANNDLWLTFVRNGDGDVARPDPKRVLPSQTVGAYSWWGTSYTWSPDGTKLAYARPDQVGWVDLETRRAFPIADFAPLNTRSDWVWAPTSSWSPDSGFIASVVHGQPKPGQGAEESQRFELWAFSLTPQVRARLVDPVGMWGTPLWSSPREGGESLIAYAQADDPFNSQQNPYALKVMDRDGSNKRVVFPVGRRQGMLPPVAYDWSPDGRQLVVLYQGDLHLVDLGNGQVQQLTGDGQCTRLDWAE